ncbi:MAG: tetratricopeptide repeat protein, partial [Pseudomonadota bacterium]|nr:tetratricopeptide repeat protein [Pseudomonadota bacterium]MEC9286104.1 tetratricopeptide repeat protein [Pseudomonadota bacterium]
MPSTWRLPDMSVERMRRDFVRRLTVYVRVMTPKTCSWGFRVTVFVTSGFLYAVDLEGLSFPMAETLRTAQDKVERDVKILASPEERSNARGDLAMLYHAQFLLDVAEVEYTKAIEEVSLPRWHYLRGVVRMDRGGVREAIEDFTRVIKQEPNNHLALYRLGVALAVTGDYSQARAVLLRAELHGPESPALLSALADVAIGTKNWDLAKAYLERCWRVEESGQVAYKLGLVWARLGDLKASRQWVARRSPTAPTIRDPQLLEVAELSVSPQFFVKAAKWAWERGDVDEALQAYRFAANLAPDDAVIGLGFARVLE